MSRPGMVGDGKAIASLVKALHGGQPNAVSGSNDVKRINTLLLPVVFSALIAALGVGLSASAVGPVMLWVFASLTAGGVMGFLFGIPKSSVAVRSDTQAPGVAGSPSNARNATPSDGLRARPNTNLEEVSDWLTKILVGLTLVNLTELTGHIRHIALNAAASIRAQPTASDVSVATALVVGFGLIGFLAMYLYTRLFLQGAIVRSDGQMNRYLHAVEVAERVGQTDSVQEVGQDPEAVPMQPVVPSAASLSAAQAVADVAPPDQEVVLQPLRQLAGEYESLRGQQDYSSARTRMMAEIVRRMRPHAIAAAPYIAALTRSASTGEHLAATIILQMKYMPEHMEWLARRLVEERAFIGYQAASALLARIKVAGPPEAEAIRAAVQTAQADRARNGSVEASLDRLIDQIVTTR